MVAKIKTVQPVEDVVDSYDGMHRSVASNYMTGRMSNPGASPNTYIRSEYTRSDYDFYRGYESSLKSPYENLRMSMKAYDKVGIVRNVIDLMADFVCKGIKLVHPVASQQRFFEEWFEYVNGDHISERFVNYLYRIANVPVNITYGKMPIKIEKKWSSANGTDAPIQEITTEYRRIPLKYSFINPLNIEVLSPELTLFTGKPVYALRVTSVIVSAMSRLKSENLGMTDEEIMNLVPGYILDAVKNNKTLVPLVDENIKMFQYKKDDWKVWADPMISSILDDITLLEKMKLADSSALDGAVSNIRLWTLGYIGDSPQTSVMPTKFMINKLRNILSNNIGGGTMDLVWGPELKFQDSDTHVHQFLGKVKYEPTLMSIYEGLGVPFSTSSSNKGMNNNFIQMQTFVERLEYGRKILLDFWNCEIKKIQQAMGYAKPAIVSFDQINLGDDSVYKQMLIGLLDRDVISVDTLLDNFGMFSEVEKIKIRREHKMRDSQKLQPKAGPFHNPQNADDMKKIILQNGGATPSQIGLNLPDKKPGEQTPAELQADTQLKLADKKATQQANKKFSPSGKNGRPTGKKDSSKRKQKSIPISTKASEFTNMFLWGCKAQEQISELVTPILLENLYKKKNVRSLTTDEFNRLEAAKLTVFSHLLPYTDVTSELVKSIAVAAEPVNADILTSIKTLILFFREKNDREPTIEETRQIQSSGYALFYEPEQNSELEFED